MSLPAPHYRCDRCSFNQSFIPIETFKYSLPDGRTGSVPVQIGWCRSCAGVGLIEDLPSAYSAYLAAARARADVSADSRVHPEVRAYRVEAAADAGVLLEVLRVRTSPERCLSCGSTDVVRSVVVPAPTPDGEEPLVPGIPHPECGGHITGRRDEWKFRADWIRTEVQVDLNGNRVG